MKKNNTTEKSILNAEKLTKALKEGTEKTLQSIINEAIGNLIRENEDEVEEPEVEVDGESEDAFDVEDVETDETPEVTDAESEENTEEAPESEDEGEGDEWSEYEKFKTDDNDYDFTGEDEDASEKILKIFDMIEDGDEVIVTKDNGKISVSHVDTDAAEEIELGSDTDEENDAEIEIEVDDEPEAEFEPEVEPEVESDDETEKEFEFEIDDEEGLDESTNLGYTDNYQSKTAMTTPSNKEVANPKDTYSMDDVPEGDGKRWAGKGSSEPFTQSVNEEDIIAPEGEEMPLTEEDELVDEATNVGGAVQQRSTSKSKVPAGRKEYVPKVTKNASFGSDFESVVEAIKKENAELKEGLKIIKGNLREAAILNVNLGRIVNLLVNETTTREEKKSILKRFNNVKTINEGADLYNTIKSELNESKKNIVNIDNEVVTATKTNLNETTIYQDRISNPSLSLMDRMDNLYRK